MGFFSKIWKGTKKVFKKIGNAIKKVFTKVGKFMNKLGVIGQIGLLFAMPYISAGLSSLWSGIAGQTAAQAGASAAGAAAGTAAAQTATAAAIEAGATQAAAQAAGAAAYATAATSAASAATAAGTLGTATGLMAGGGFSQAVGSLMQGATKFVTGTSRVWNTITEGVSSFIGEFSKTAASKLGFTVEGAAENFFFGPGTTTAWGATKKAVMTEWQTGAALRAATKTGLEMAKKGEFDIVAEPFSLDINIDKSTLNRPTIKGTLNKNVPLSELPVLKETPTSILSQIKQAVGEKAAGFGQKVTSKTAENAIIATATQAAFGSDIAQEEYQATRPREIVDFDYFGQNAFSVAPTQTYSISPVVPLQYASTYTAPVSAWAIQQQQMQENLMRGNPQTGVYV